MNMLKAAFGLALAAVGCSDGSEVGPSPTDSFTLNTQETGVERPASGDAGAAADGGVVASGDGGRGCSAVVLINDHYRYCVRVKQRVAHTNTGAVSLVVKVRAEVFIGDLAVPSDNFSTVGSMMLTDGAPSEVDTVLPVTIDLSGVQSAARSSIRKMVRLNSSIHSSESSPALATTTIVVSL